MGLKMTQLQFRWFLLVCFGVVGVLGIAWPRLPYEVETTWICPVSGKYIRETATGFPRRRERVVEADGLVPWLRRRDPEFEPKPVLLCRRERLLFKVTRSCHAAPPIAFLQPILADLPERLAEKDLREMIQVLRTGTSAEQDRVVRRIKRAFELAVEGRPVAKGRNER